MKTTLGLWIAALVPLAAGCTNLERQTPEMIRAREPVLFEGTARIGRIESDGSGSAVFWESPDTAVVTPTTLYLGDYGKVPGTDPVFRTTLPGADVATLPVESALRPLPGR